MTAPATSSKDPRIVRAARLLRDPAARREEGAFVIDHEDLLHQALTANLTIELCFTPQQKGTVPLSFTAEHEGTVPFCFTGEDGMRALSVVGEVPRVVAVVRTPPSPLDLPPSSLVLAGVADAGNVGSIVRTARALGLPRVALTPECADPWSRRALRAALGASFAPGLVATERPLQALAALPDRPPLAAAVARGGQAPETLPPGAAVVLGSERDGLTPGERACCDLEVTVPAAGFESLNVAAAAAILAYGMATRRAPGRGGPTGAGGSA